MDPIALMAREQAELVALLDRREAVRAALDLLAAEGDVAWVAEPHGGERTSDLILRQVRGNRTGLLGLHVPQGLGLTGKVHREGSPSWVDDYFRAAEITHTFDRHIDTEGVRRLLAVPVVGVHTIVALARFS